jgi:sulfatase modifying factor 1
MPPEIQIFSGEFTLGPQPTNPVSGRRPQMPSEPRLPCGGPPGRGAGGPPGRSGEPLGASRCFPQRLGSLLAPLLLAVGLAKPMFADVFQMPAGLRSLELVLVGDPGNPADATGRGGVAYPFRIGKYEVTAAQYTEFLNAKAKSDADGNLWNNDMDKVRSGAEDPRCDIRRSGTPGAFHHTVAADYANRPVTHLSFLDACRFCNWLHNGQGEGDTETGAYTLNGYKGTDGRRIRRNAGAKYFIPTEDEWSKAAYYDPNKPGGPGYWNYPTRSDLKPGRDPASTNAANWYAGGFLDPVHFYTEVGRFSLANSAYGTFDQAGNVFEWTEDLHPPFLRTLRGGAYDSDDAGLNVPTRNPVFSSISDVPDVGFRVAASVPGQAPPMVATVPAAPSSATVPAPAAAVQDFPRRPWLDPLSGKPFFPLAWFSYASDAKDLDELHAQGANLVLFVSSPSDTDTDEQTTQNIDRMRAYLDHARKCDMRVLVQIGSHYDAQMRGDQAEIARQKRWVEAVRDHPALFGYQLYDEPEYAAGFGLGVETQRNLRKLVDAFAKTRQSLRQWDPNTNRMISVVFNLVPLSSWTEFLPVIDSFQVDRYPLDKEQAYFGHRGDWGPLMMAWSMHHGAAALRDHPHLRNPSPCMQGVGPNCLDSGQRPVWRNPLYEETRFMAYSSLTVGSWGVFHWIRKMGFAESPVIEANVARLYREMRQLMPAFEQSYTDPPFTVRHDHEGITRSFLSDSIADITTLPLEDRDNYYLVVSDNTGSFGEVRLRLKGLKLAGPSRREARVLNEDWGGVVEFAEASGEWLITPHPMCFGDVNVWVIPKAVPPQ